MNIKKIPASRGKNWLLEGSDLFARSPVSFLLFGLLLQMLTLLLAIPIVGALAVMGLPIFFAGALHAARQLDSGNPVRLAGFFTMFSDTAVRRPLLILGLINLLIGVLASMAMASSFLDISGLNLLDSMQSADPETLASIDLARLFSLLLQLALVFSILAAFNFFAVPLVAFQKAAPLQAMLTSFRACLVNWASLLVYGLATLILFLIVSLMLMFAATVVVMVFSGSPFGGQLMTLLTVPVLIAIQMILICAQYLAYRDIFGGAPARAASDQLLA